MALDFSVLEKIYIVPCEYILLQYINRYFIDFSLINIM